MGKRNKPRKKGASAPQSAKTKAKAGSKAKANTEAKANTKAKANTEAKSNSKSGCSTHDSGRAEGTPKCGSPSPEGIAPGKRRYLLDKLKRAAKRGDGDADALVGYIDQLWPAEDVGARAARYFHLFRHVPERAIELLDAQAVLLGGQLDDATAAAISDIAPDLATDHITAIQRTGLLPENWADEAHLVRQAATIIANGDSDDASQQLKQIGLRSPFKNVRLFLRGLAALYGGATAESERAFSAIPDSSHLKAVAAHVREELTLELAPIAEAIVERRPSRALAAASRVAPRLPPVAQEALARDFVAALAHLKIGAATAVDRVKKAMPDAMSPLLCDLLVALASQSSDTAATQNRGATDAQLWGRVERHLRGKNKRSDAVQAAPNHGLGIPGEQALVSAQGQAGAQRAAAMRREADELLSEAREIEEDFDTTDESTCPCPDCRAEGRFRPWDWGDDGDDMRDIARMTSLTARAERISKERLQLLWELTELDPAHVDHWKTLVAALAETDDAKAQARAVDNMAKALPENPEALLTGAEAAASRGAWDKALRYVRNALRVEPLSRRAADLEADILWGKALKKSRQGKNLEASALLEDAVAVGHRTQHSVAKIAGKAAAALHAYGNDERGSALWQRGLDEAGWVWLQCAHALLSLQELDDGNETTRSKSTTHRRRRRPKLKPIAAPRWLEQNLPSRDVTPLKPSPEEMRALAALVCEHYNDMHGPRELQQYLYALLGEAIMTDAHTSLQDEESLIKCLHVAFEDPSATIRVAEHGQALHPDTPLFFLSRYTAAIDLGRPAEYFANYQQDFDYHMTRATQATEAPPAIYDLLEMLDGEDPEAAEELRAAMAQLSTGSRVASSIQALDASVSNYLARIGKKKNKKRKRRSGNEAQATLPF